MTVAEQWAYAWCMGRPTPSQIVARINMIAERAAYKSKSAIACDTPITVIEGVEYVEVSRAQDAIDLNRWWEVEA